MNKKQKETFKKLLNELPTIGKEYKQKLQELKMSTAKISKILEQMIKLTKYMNDDELKEILSEKTPQLDLLKVIKKYTPKEFQNVGRK